MPDWALFEPGRRPIPYACTTWAEMVAHLNTEVWALAARGEVQTLVVELSFLAEDLVDAFRPNAGKNGWQPFMDLANAMKFLDTMAKAKGVNVVYNAIDDGEGGILMPGNATARKQPALCDLTGYLQNVSRAERVLHLEPFEKNTPRHRFFDRLPGKVVNPTYRKLLGLLRGELIADANGNVTQLDGTPLPSLTVAPAATSAPVTGGGMRRLGAAAAATPEPTTTIRRMKRP
jgi:hypothetical protein